MSPTTLVALFVRLFAIGLVVYLVQIIATEYSTYANFDDYSFGIAAITAVVLIAFLAVFLWKFPLFVASKLIQSDTAEAPEVKIEEEGLYRLGFILLGTYLLYWAISETVFWWYLLSLQSEYRQFDYELGTQEKASILSTGIKFVMALMLILGSKRISRWILGLRRAGTK